MKRILGALAVCALAILSCQVGDVYFSNVEPPDDDFRFGKPTDGGFEFNFDGNVCAAQSKEVELIELDIALILDTSFSMSFPVASSKWANVRLAVKGFVANPAFENGGVAVQYFPKRKLCSVDAYRNFAVPWLVLPDTDDTIAQSLDNKSPEGGTPMAPVMEAAVIEARNRAAANPDRRVVIVLATDGIPDKTCQVPGPGGSFANTLDNVVAIALDGYIGGPEGLLERVRTFVIGVGDQLTALNQIAEAGGTDEALLVSTDGDVQKLFAEALLEVRRKAVTCEYEIPEPDNGELDPDRVNFSVSYQGATEVFTQVENPSECSSAPQSGWFFDNPSDPTRIVLCPLTCERVRALPGAQVEILFGCATIVG